MKVSMIDVFDCVIRKSIAFRQIYDIENNYKILGALRTLDWKILLLL